MTALAVAVCVPAVAQGASATSPRSSAVTRSSNLDSDLFLQVLISELELREGNSTAAVHRMTELARRQRDERIFRRAVDMAVEARSVDEALTALREWRRAVPRSTTAAEMHAQVLIALGRPTEASEPLRVLLEHTPAAQRPAAIAALPRLVVRGTQTRPAVQMLDEVLRPWKEQPATRSAAQLALARSWWIAGETARSIEVARELQAEEPASDGVAMLGLDMMAREPDAESLVRSYLKSAHPAAVVRLAYARRLTASQRYREALASVQAATAAEPQMASGWMMQGALLLELGEPAQAQLALERYLALKQPTERGTAAASPSLPDVSNGERREDDDDTDDEVRDAQAAAAAQELSQAYLMLAQAAEQLKDYRGAQGWLEKLGDTQAQAGVVQRRASLLARQGRVDEARQLLRQLPEGTPDEVRTRVMAETQLLRDVQRWREAYDVLVDAAKTLPDDVDLLYEQALLAEKLRRYDEMETLLRRVITLKPDQQHAYNALGYSLAERGIRLPEARELVSKALAMAPGDPFITDSLAWVEYRSGNRAVALKLLRDAYERRPDVEIAAHLGEVLWVDGQRDAALKVWRAGRERDPTNDVLVETIKRLKARL